MTPTSASTRATGLEPLTAHEPAHVVVLDEDEFARRAFRLVLERSGFLVTVTAVATQALDRVELDGADVLVAAHRVGGISGTGVLNTAREGSKRCIRVLLVPRTDGDAPPPSSRGVPPDLTLTKSAALARLPRALSELLKKQREAEEDADAEAVRVQAHRVARAVARGGSEQIARDERLALWSRRFAAAVGLGRARALDLELGALLHDVGQVGAPNRRHPMAGVDLLREIPALRRAVPVVASHHERYDGSGFPRGLAARAIAYEARIFRVLDTYDAILSGPAALSHASAVEQLRALSGSELDPAVVEAFAKIPAHSWSPSEVRRVAA